MNNASVSCIAIIFAVTTGCSNQQNDSKSSDDSTTVVTPDSSRASSAAQSQDISLPEPYATKSARNFSNVIGWPKDKAPVAPAGFAVNKYADNLDNPRWIYVAPNGDILVAEANPGSKGLKKVKDILSGKAKSRNTRESGNRIRLLRDTNKDGKADLNETFLSGLNKPFGMLILGKSFFVACTDGVWKYPYMPGENSISGQGQLLIKLPAGGYNNHWTRNIIANPEGSKIYISVGSGSNVGENGMENEVRRANILEVNPDGSGERIFASGLRNPVGMDWDPVNKELWTAVNERDELGDELVPDYITSVKEGAFYGWPFAYFGQHEDPRRKGENPDLVKKARVPDLAVGAHTASLGLAFYDAKSFPERYQNGAFVGQHGSWNRSTLAGYKVLFVPFKDGKPAGNTEDFLTGFISNSEKEEVYGRPVGVSVLKDGSLLVADDAGNIIWRVSAELK